MEILIGIIMWLLVAIFFIFFVFPFIGNKIMWWKFKKVLKKIIKTTDDKDKKRELQDILDKAQKYFKEEKL